jgi:hypothetical protein
MKLINFTKFLLLVACWGSFSAAHAAVPYYSPDLASRRARLETALRAFADSSSAHPGIKIICNQRFVEFWITGMPKIVVPHTPAQGFGELRSQEELKQYFELLSACSMLQAESWEEVMRNNDGTILTRLLN